MSANVKYEFHLLEQWSAQAIPDSTELDLFRDIPQGTLRKEVERIKQTFIQEVFCFDDEQHLERYIQYHQQALIRLMDASQHRGTSELSNTALVNAYDELLTFIERHFSKYFDQDAKAPSAYISLARADARNHMRKLAKAFQDRQADPQVVDIMLYAFKRIVDGDNGISYRKVIYAKQVKRELYRLLERETSDFNDALRQMMYYLNYNSLKTFAYHTRHIESHVQQEESRNGKVEKLSYYLKTINQTQVKPGVWFNADVPSLQEQLRGFIVEEIEYHRNVHQLDALGKNDGGAPFYQNMKFRFDASVAQMACLLKILLDNHIIQNGNLTDTIRLVSRIVVTKRSEVVSYDSLRAKFYNIEHSTWLSVRASLLRLIQYIDKIYS